VALLLVLTLPVATLSWVLLERPLLRRTAGWEKRSNARAAARRRRDESDAGSLAAGAQAPLPASTRP
jgi:peptidoglycan/LPS O-acetylase OafA/YrhL